jgi:hypothetical protein
VYNWIVYLHIAAGFGFFIAHGVAMFVGFALRSESAPERIKALLDLSQRTLGMLYICLVLILLTGIGAGFVGSWWGRGWIWASLVLLIVVLVLMMVRGSRFYASVREAVGAPVYGKMSTPPPTSPEELERLLKSPRPFELAAIGGIGFLVLLWLMVFKPF